MKKLIALCLGLMAIASLSAQQLFFETYSGYNLTSYDLEEFEDSEGYVPIGFRLAGGFERVQFGLEYNRNITDASFTSSDPSTGTDLFRTQFVNSYYGGLVRVNFSSLPAYRFGLVLKGGAGRYDTQVETYELPNESLRDPVVEYEPELGFNFGIGISSPIYTLLHWEIGYMYNLVKYAETTTGAPSYQGNFHSIQIGLSLNLVFGNTAKRCRQVYKNDRSSRGWRR
ncbi:MAG: hypothetical protein AAFP19_16430 [Bacteroidota bacterium]